MGARGRRGAGPEDQHRAGTCRKAIMRGRFWRMEVTERQDVAYAVLLIGQRRRDMGKGAWGDLLRSEQVACLLHLGVDAFKAPHRAGVKFKVAADPQSIGGIHEGTWGRGASGDDGWSG